MSSIAGVETVTIIKRLPPYANLRKYHGFTQSEAAERLGICTETLSNYERAVTVPPKEIIREMDQLYQCHGELVEYWFNTKFSAQKRTFLMIIREALKKVFRR